MCKQTASNAVVVLVVALCCARAALGAVGTLADGTLVGWGDNGFGQTTVPSGTFTSIAAGGAHSLGIKSDGTLAGWGSNTVFQATVPIGTFTAIAGGHLHSLGIKSDAALAGWGLNDGQISVPNGSFTAIAAGDHHSLGIKSVGTLAAWGENFNGQSTVPSGTFTAIAAGGAFSLGIKSDGTLAGWGSNTIGQTTVPSGTFTAIAAGDNHSLGIKSDGTLAGWGSNADGQTNVPSGTFMAIAAGNAHSLGLRSDGTLAGWGFNSFGATTVPNGTFTAIAAGGNHSLGLRAVTAYDGDLRIFGTGVTANINRSIEVAGDVTIESAVNYYNNPIVEIGGKLILKAGANFTGSGTLNTNGLEVLSVYQLSAATTIANSGPLTGTAHLVLNTGAHLDIGLAPANAYSGALSLSSSATVTLQGTGTQSAYLLGLSAGSEFRMGGGQRMRLTNTAAGSALLNSGKLEIIGSSQLGPGELDVLGLTINSGGNALITARDAIMRFTGGMRNYDSIVVTGGVNDISGDIENYNTGKVVVTGGATAIFYDDVVNDGTITVRQLGSSTATAIFLGGVSGSGSFNGAGDILIEGDLRPGNSAALVTFDNNVALGSGTSLEIELGGMTAGAQFDQLNVINDLTLDGTLDVSLINGFTPQAGNSFNILDWGSLSGTFDTLVLPALGGTLTWNTSQLYTTGVLSVASAGVLGDYNNNGTVDAADYVLWRKGGPLANEVDNPGTVNAADYTAWRARFGQPAGSGSGASANSTVPEPATLMLIILSATGWCVRRRATY